MLRSYQLLRSKARTISFHTDKFNTSHHDCRDNAVFRSVHPNCSWRKLAVIPFSSYPSSNSESSIKNFCKSKGIPESDLRTGSGEVVIKDCPFCHPIKGKADNQYKLFIKIGDGCFHCHRCNASGSWTDFKKELITGSDAPIQDYKKRGDFHLDTEPRYRAAQKRTSNVTVKGKCNPPEMPDENLAKNCSSNLMNESPGARKALDYLNNERGLETETLRKYGVGLASYKYKDKKTWVSSDSITFPWMIPSTLGDGSYSLCRIKARSLERKDWQRMYPRGGKVGLFGYDTIPQDAKEIVITEGEYDAMAVYQETGRAAVSLPNGTGSKPDQFIDLLKRFEKVYLWMDNDDPGQKAARKIAEQIGIQRCFLVKPELNGTSLPKDANDALKMKQDLDEIINGATILQHENLTTFKENREEVIDAFLHPEKYKGVESPSFPGLTSIVKGFRLGEMTIITGPTGSGKTTFLSQLSIDFAEQGVGTLWGSFEIKNVRLMQKMLQQFHRKQLPIDSKDGLNKICDKLEALPFTFTNFHGSTDVDEVIDAMQYAVTANNVKHVIIDNLQFMLSPQPSFNKFDMQDNAIAKFRRFATERNVHLILVVHPRKEAEDKLDIDSIYGGAKVTQEADLVMILQSDGTNKYMDVKKNRFDGTLGYSPLFFDRQTLRYMEKPIVGASSEKRISNNANPMSSRSAASSQSSTISKNKHTNVDDHWGQFS
mmetsp:Transcript_18316/g.27129  ORF Transcript_18316/g.27129 Transcript_18316/m.27129 type:complete len:713 (+) Transcript_18316:72-2210(+)